MFRGIGTCPDGGAANRPPERLEASSTCFAKSSRCPTRKPNPARAAEEKAYRMAQAFLKGMRVEREGRSVLVRSAGLGTLADFASLVAAGVIEF